MSQIPQITPEILKALKKIRGEVDELFLAAGSARSSTELSNLIIDSLEEVASAYVKLKVARLLGIRTICDEDDGEEWKEGVD